MNVDELLREHAPPEAAVRHEAQRIRDAVLETALSGAVDARAVALPRIPRRRRRTLVRVIVAAAVLGVVATGLTISFDGGSPASAAQERFTKAAAAPAYDTYGAFSTGNTVYIGNHQVTFDEKIKAMYYTSAGVLVRMGKVDYTDASGPSHYTLIRPNGSHTKIDVKMGGRHPNIDLNMGDGVPATDPGSPDAAYAEPTGDHWSFVVINLVTGKEVARTEVRGAFTWGGWEAPPVTMEGHRMWALFDAGWMEYDWKTGKTRLVPGTKDLPLATAHGLYVDFKSPKDYDYQIKDFVTGKIIRTIPMKKGSNPGTFSPNGQYMRFRGSMGNIDEKGNVVEPPGPSSFLTLATGKVVHLPGQNTYGWTPGGNTLVVDPKNDRLTVCNPGTGKCDRIDLKIGTGKVKLGGLPYES